MNKKIIIIASISISIIIISTIISILIFMPSNESINMYDANVFKVIADGHLREDVFEYEGERYFSYDLVKSSIDKYIWLEEKARKIIITDGYGITTIDLDESDNILIRSDRVFFKENFIKEQYIKNDDLSETYAYTEINYIVENNISIIINKEMDMGDITSRKDKLYIRKGPSIKEPKVKTEENAKGSNIAKLLEYTNEKWIKVMAFTGEIGYVRRSDVDIIENNMYTGNFKGTNRYLPGIHNSKNNNINDFKNEFRNNKINMVWEAVYSRNPDVTQIGDMPGLNVIAPTWFELIGEDGSVKNMADIDYVNWAHGRGYYVWGTIVSVTNYDLTSSVLSDYEIRHKYVNQIIEYAKQYNLDGINIDFEYMYEEDKDLFTQFVRELSALCRIEGLVVSCDVTVLSNSPKWSLCYDRESLSDSVDYMCVMFYDQYSGGGGRAGSVSQLSWTVNSLKNILPQIPHDKEATEKDRLPEQK